MAVARARAPRPTSRMLGRPRCAGGYLASSRQFPSAVFAPTHIRGQPPQELRGRRRAVLRQREARASASDTSTPSCHGESGPERPKPVNCSSGRPPRSQRVSRTEVRGSGRVATAAARPILLLSRVLGAELPRRHELHPVKEDLCQRCRLDHLAAFPGLTAGRHSGSGEKPCRKAGGAFHSADAQYPIPLVSQPLSGRHAAQMTGKCPGSST